MIIPKEKHLRNKGGRVRTLRQKPPRRVADAGARGILPCPASKRHDVRQVCDGRGLDAEILIMGYTFPSQAPQLAEHGITAALTDLNHANSLADAAKSAGVVISCHIKIDTGMNRLGFPALCDADIASTADNIEEILKNKNLNITGIFTHFSKADEELPENGEKNLTFIQYRRFMKLCDILKTRVRHKVQARLQQRCDTCFRRFQA